MKRGTMRRALFCLLMPALSSGIWAAENDVAPEEIIKKFAAKEAEFAKARENYTYRQSVRVLDLTPSGATAGKWEMISDIVFSGEGKRTEKVVRAPVPTLVNFFMSPEDEQDLRNVQPFVLTTKEIPDYDIRYMGRQKADEIPCYLFAVKPKKMVHGKRYFEGEIWVDDRDLQIVKTFGKGVGLLKKGTDQQFPRFETYREQIDGKYWFPTYTRADDELHFQNQTARVRMTVKYEDYKQFKSDATITFGEVVGEGKKPDVAPKKK